jgi:hypothetical protein
MMTYLKLRRRRKLWHQSHSLDPHISLVQRKPRRKHSEEIFELVLLILLSEHRENGEERKARKKHLKLLSWNPPLGFLIITLRADTDLWSI